MRLNCLRTGRCTDQERMRYIRMWRTPGPATFCIYLASEAPLSLMHGKLPQPRSRN